MRCMMEEQNEMAGVQAPPSGTLKPAIDTYSKMTDLQQILDLFHIDFTKGQHSEHQKSHTLNSFSLT